MIYKKIDVLLFLISISILNASAVNTLKDQKAVTIHTPEIVMVIDYASKASITSLIVNGQKVMQNADGVFTSLKINGVTYSSLHLMSAPALTQTKGEWKISRIKYLSSRNLTINEIWTLQNHGNAINKIQRHA